MAERHSIVVHVREGRVQDVAFCECCTPVTVEVRMYEAETAGKYPPIPGGTAVPRRLADDRWQDSLGVFRVTYYEPDEAANAEPAPPPNPPPAG
jgi:hypothetical protein